MTDNEDTIGNEVGYVYDGLYKALPTLLAEADAKPEWRPALAELGRELTDHLWRSSFKRQREPKTGLSAWAWLREQLERSRPKDAGPWWFILDYADGEPVSDDVRKFFETA